MKQVLDYKELKIIFKRSYQAKHINLKVRQGEVILTAPPRAPLDHSLELVDRHIEWIQNRLQSYRKIGYKPGSVIHILGREYTIYHTDNPFGNTFIEGNQIIVSGREYAIESRVKRFLVDHLRTEITKLADRFCIMIDAGYNIIVVREMNTKWGSCTAKHNLSFATKLVFTPYWVLEYVVAHEVCHLKEFNHSPRFWSLVASIYPEYKMAKRWLKEHGIALI